MTDRIDIRYADSGDPDFVAGLASSLLEFGSRASPAVERFEDALTDVRRERFPLVTQFAAELRSGTGEERFSFAIETFLDGLVTRHRSDT